MYINKSFNFDGLDNLLFALGELHDNGTLDKIRDCLNAIFADDGVAVCKKVIYTENTDNLFFGIKVYPDITENDISYIFDEYSEYKFHSYAVEIDSKLLDPILCLYGREITSLLIYSVTHAVYDSDNIFNLIKSSIDIYFTRTGEYYDIKSSIQLKELLAYGIKDACCKLGSPFTKSTVSEIMKDSLLVELDMAKDIYTALRKITTNFDFLNNQIDDRFIVLSWVLRVAKDFEYFKVPAYKTLVKAIEFTGSRLEKMELQHAANLINNANISVREGFFEDIGKRFNDANLKFKRKGIAGIKSDVYELQLRLRTAETEAELMSIIREANTKINILQDYLTEDIPDVEREEISRVIQDLYRIRQQAASSKDVRSRYSGFINVIYPEASK